MTSKVNLQSAMLLLSRAERRSIITIQCRSVKTTRMVRHPAALLLLSLLRLLSLRLPPRRRPGRSGAGLNCVLCTAIQTLQCQKQSDGERKYSNTDSDPPGRGRSKTM